MIASREVDRGHGCSCTWVDESLIFTVRRSCPVGEHRAAFWDAWRSRRLTAFRRGVRVAIAVLTGRPRVGPGDLVIYTPDPLLLGGELVVLDVTADNRLTCEQVNYDGDAPARGVFDPFDLELASVWARAAA